MLDRDELRKFAESQLAAKDLMTIHPLQMIGLLDENETMREMLKTYMKRPQETLAEGDHPRKWEDHADTE